MTLYDSSSVVYDASTLSFDGFDPPLANMPAVGVFIAFTDGPYVADCDWTDVSYLVRQVSIRRGRQDDLQQFPAGQASVTFDNRDGYFDPFNNLSPAPFNGNLKPRKQIKIVAMWNGVAYPLFRGFVAGWPVEYTDAGLDSTVTVDCFDALGLLATEVVPVDWPDYYTKQFGARHYWKFNDPRTSRSILDSGSSPTLTIDYSEAVAPSAYSYEQPQMLAGCVGTSLFYKGVGRAVDGTSDVGNFTVSFVVLAPQESTLDPEQSIEFQINGLTLEIGIRTDNFEARCFVSNNAWSREFDLPKIADTDPTHIVIAVTGNSGNKPTISAYYNGVSASATLVSETTTTLGDLYELFSPGELRYQEVALFTSVLSATQITTIYNALTARFPETTTTRIVRLIGTTEFPTELQDFSGLAVASVTELQSGAGLVPELQTVTQSEDGVLFVDRTGVLTFGDRYWWSRRPRSNTEQFTFSNNSSYSVDYADRTLQYFLDADRIRNDSSVRFSGSGVATVRDQDSIDEFGAASETISTILDSPSSATDLATYRVTAYKTPKLALSPLTAQGQQDPALNWPYLLSIELLDRVGFTFAPSVGTTVSKDLLVQSVEHRFTPGTWETVVNGSTRFTGWGIWDVTLWDSSEDVWFG